MRSSEPFLPRPALEAVFAALGAGTAEGSLAKVLATLESAVEDYRPVRRALALEGVGTVEPAPAAARRRTVVAGT